MWRENKIFSVVLVVLFVELTARGNDDSDDSSFDDDLENDVFFVREIGKHETVGGKFTKPRKWRFIVALNVKTSCNQSNLCMGSIIKDNWILTAAHCFPDDTIDVYGKTDTYSLYFNGEHFKTIALVIHPEYRRYPTYSLNDLAMLKIHPKIYFSKDIRSVTVANRLQPKTSICRTASWSKDLSSVTEFKAPPYTLREIGQKFLFLGDCSKPKEPSKTKFVCTKNHITDSCFPDFGAPLICSRKLHGIISKSACGDSPNWWTPIEPHAKWIFSTMKSPQVANSLKVPSEQNIQRQIHSSHHKHFRIEKDPSELTVDRSGSALSVESNVSMKNLSREVDAKDSDSLMAYQDINYDWQRRDRDDFDEQSLSHFYGPSASHQMFNLATFSRSMRSSACVQLAKRALVAFAVVCQ